MMQKTLLSRVLPGAALAVCCRALLPAQTVDCDTVPVVAQATAGYLTCLQPTATLSGALDPTALSYFWSGPGGFVSSDRVITRHVPGPYLLTVTGAYGCTATTSMLLVDSCAFYPLQPPECSNAFEPGADFCTDACVRAFINGQYGFTGDYTPDFVPDFCGTIQNNQWLAFVAGAPSGSITVQPDSCAFENGVQLAVFEACGESPIACNPGAPGNNINPVTVDLSGLIIGKVYYLMVDGYEGDRCTFQLSSTNGVCDGGGPHPVSPPQLSGPDLFCPNATQKYSLADSVKANAFLWTAPPGALINGLPSPLVLYVPEGKSVDITFGDQEGEVCVRLLYYFRKPDPPVCLSVKKQVIPPTILPTAYVCFSDLPFVWTEEPFIVINSPGTFNLTSTPYESYLGCDSIVKQTIVVGPYIHTNLSLVVRCAGECFNIGGDNYCESGTYSVALESWMGCDSIVNFQLLVLNPVAKILGATELNCSTPSVTLSAAPGSGTFTWYTGSGQLIGSGTSLVVFQPGMYVLRNTQVAAGKLCIQSDTVVIVQDITPVQITTQNAVLTCSAPAAALAAVVNPPGASLQWSGPNGFTSTEPAPVVNAPGLYTLTATTPNACTATATINVSADLQTPGATAIGGTLTCAAPFLLLDGASDDPDAIYAWSGPDGFSSNLQNPEVSIPGTYFLTVSADNGCQSMAEAEVAADQVAPEIELPAVVSLTCAAPAATLSVLSSQLLTYVWSGPIGIPITDSPVVDIPGVYTVTVTAANGCTASASTEVVEHKTAPSILVYADTLSCGMPMANLHAVSDTPGALFKWAGPGGFESTEPNPAVSEAGPYSLTVTDPANGCTAVAIAEVFSDITLFDISALQQPPGCADSVLVVDVSVAAAGATYTWTGPDGFVAQGATIQTATAGWYQVTAQTPNGCSAEISILVVAAPQNPVLTLAGDTINCLQPEAHLTVSSDIAGSNFWWTDPAGTSYSGTELATSLPGLFAITAVTPQGCTATAMLTLPADTSAPELTAAGGVLTCDHPELTLMATSATPGATVAWAGGSGADTLTVNEGGDYTAVATGANGCTQSITVLVIDSCALVAVVEPDAQNGFRLFPNASTGMVQLQALGTERIEAYRVLRSDGALLVEEQVLLPANTLKMDLTALSAGTYFVTARVDGRWYHHPLILLQ